MRNEIILIGPMLAGKSTVATVIANKTKMPVIQFDDIKWDFFIKYGVTKQSADRILTTEGVSALLSYLKPYELMITEEIFSTYQDCIFDLGAGFSVSDEYYDQIKIKSYLSAFRNKFLILPSENDNGVARTSPINVTDEVNRQVTLGRTV